MSYMKSQEERIAWLLNAQIKTERLFKIVERVAQCDDAADSTRGVDTDNIAYLRGMAEGLREAFGILSR